MGNGRIRGQGPEYAQDQETEIGLITGKASGLLKTRAQKAAEQQTERTRQHAEVFTPAWICRMMTFGEYLKARWDRLPSLKEREKPSCC